MALLLGGEKGSCGPLILFCDLTDLSTPRPAKRFDVFLYDSVHACGAAIRPYLMWPRFFSRTNSESFLIDVTLLRQVKIQAVRRPRNILTLDISC